VSNLIWNNPGQGGESADREHETVLASLKRQQRRLEEGGVFTYSETTDKRLSGKRDPRIYTATRTHFYANEHIPTHTSTKAHRHFKWLIGLRLSAACLWCLYGSTFVAACVCDGDTFISTQRTHDNEHKT